MKHELRVVFVIIGSIIGAGFASGQEIKLFFTDHGICGLLGIVISTFIIVLIINYSLKIIMKNNISNYFSFLETIFKNKKIIVESMKNITNLFLVVCFFIMSIGFSTCLEQQFLIPRIIRWDNNIHSLLYGFYRRY